MATMTSQDSYILNQKRRAQAALDALYKIVEKDYNSDKNYAGGVGAKTYKDFIEQCKTNIDKLEMVLGRIKLV